MILEPRIQKLIFVAAQRRDTERHCEWFRASLFKVNKITSIYICVADRRIKERVTAGNLNPRTEFHTIKLQTAMLCALPENCTIRKTFLRNRRTWIKLLGKGEILYVLV